jgi:hypothetical protein
MLKNYILILFLFFGTTLEGCRDLDLPGNTPRCIEQKIRKFARKEAFNRGSTVTQYSFQGQFVYVFSPGNKCGADIVSEVVDSGCNTVCRLGSIVGNLNCNGGNFAVEATNEKVIWRN